MVVFIRAAVAALCLVTTAIGQLTQIITPSMTADSNVGYSSATGPSEIINGELSDYYLMNFSGSTVAGDNVWIDMGSQQTVQTILIWIRS